MLAWWLCDFSGDPDQYGSEIVSEYDQETPQIPETLHFCDFSVGVRTPCPPPLSGSAHEVKSRFVCAYTAILVGQMVKAQKNVKKEATYIRRVPLWYVSACIIRIFSAFMLICLTSKLIVMHSAAS